MSSDSDEDMKRAIALSLADNAKSGDGDAQPTGIDGTESGSMRSVLAGLDRKAMEEGRLARVARKRQREISPPALQSPRKAPRLEAKTVTLSSGARLTSFASAVTADQETRKTEAANRANQRLRSPEHMPEIKQEPTSIEDPNRQDHVRYPNGIVKKTWAFGHPRDGNDVKLEEVLEANTLKTAVLSAFQWDMDWVLSKLKTPLNGGVTKCVFVMQAKEETLRQQMIQQTQKARPFLRLCFPPMPGQVNCMHSKLMLLFHPNKLRIAIPTANLLNFDWGETGVMENSVWMIDLPRLPAGGKMEHDELTDFGKELLHFLDLQKLDRDIRTGVLNFDFTSTASVMFVHTAGGSSFDDNMERTGLPGLGRAVRKLDIQTNDKTQIDFAASSIGSLNDEYLQSLHAAARGENMITRAQDQVTQAKAGFFDTAHRGTNKEGATIREKIRIYFPTHQTVTSSTAGAAGTICLSRKWFEGQNFPRTCFRDYRSLRRGLLSHNKLLYVRGKQACTHHHMDKDVAWAYVGSANFSESAWGKLVYDKKEKAWKINCRNWECGVILPVTQNRITDHRCVETPSIKKETTESMIIEEDSETESEDDRFVEANRTSKRPTEIKREEVEPSAMDNGLEESVIDMDIFANLVKPPFELPGSRYGGQQPWYFQENF